MYKIYFKQAVQMLKQNKFISIVSILGTAMAIMMIMAMVVAEEVKTVNVAPESNRDRMLYATREFVKDTIGNSVQMGYLKYSSFKNYISKMKTPEMVAMISTYDPDYTGPTSVSIESSLDQISKVVRTANAGYWAVLDFTFIEGRAYTQEEADAEMKYAVITESTAKELFKGEKALNKTININFISHEVIGIVKDVSPVFATAYSHVWRPITASDASDEWYTVDALLLAKDKKDFESIKQEVRNCEKQFGIDNAPAFIYFAGPMELKQTNIGAESANSKEDFDQQVSKKNRSTLVIMLVLLLIPAINLSGFSLSRIKKRTAEIGVRKAFGAKKYVILIQVLYENMITSLIGGTIGLALSYIAVYNMKEWLLGVPPDTNIPIQGLISPWVFITTFFICLLINLISAGIPAYGASKMSIVNSLTQNDKQL